MSTASIMSGLLNASGLKERLQEYGGKTKPLPSDFMPPEFAPAGARQEEAVDAQDDTFTSRFGRFAKQVDAEDLRNAETPDAERLGTAKPDTVELGAIGKTSGEKTADKKVADSANALAADAAEGNLPAADNTVEVKPEEAPEAEEATVFEDSDDLEETFQADRSSPLVPPQANAPDAIPAAALAAVNVTDVQTPPTGPADPARDEKAASSKTVGAEPQGPWVKGGDAPVARVGAQVAGQHARTLSRQNGGDFSQRPVANDVRSGLQAAESALRQSRPGQAPNEMALFRVADFRMSSAQSAYPGNFSEKFSRQLDMMKPVFRVLPGTDGLSRAGGVSGQAMPQPLGNAAGGTLPQVQQAIQTSLVNLARESTGNSPTVKTLELSLVPRSLGEIKVHMVHSGNQISVEISTNTAAATHAMETAKNDIVKAYLQYGIQPDDLTIRVTETRDTAQPTPSTGSEQDRFGQSGGQGLSRNGAGTAMSGGQEGAHQQEAAADRSAGGSTAKPAETPKPSRSDVMGKVQYF